jgi:thiol-disulfide isomerase/thioredoxin
LAQKSYKEFGELWGKSQELELGRYGRSIAKGTRRKAPEVTGKPMPIMGTTHDGKSFDVAQWRGKPVLVLFWATWCGPCRELMPEFKAIYEHYHADGFQIIGVSKDDDKDALSMYIDEQELPWPNLFDVEAEDSEKHPIADKYGVHAIPATFLLDREGKVVAKDLHGEPLAEKIEELMASKSPAADKPADGAKKSDEKKDGDKDKKDE